jgi:hypothetical protein
VAADATTPARGVCAADSDGSVSTVSIEPDVPGCTRIRGGDVVRVANATGDLGGAGTTVTVRWASFPPVRLGPGQTVTYPGAASSYLAPGVHDLEVDMPSRRLEQVWLE